MARRPATRVRKAPVKEIGLHMTVAAFLRRAWPAHLLWWHTPNGEARDARTGGKLKGMGVLPGVPDFVFILPNGQAAFLELKAPSGGLSEAQIDFRDKALVAHCGYATARSPEEAEQTLARWLDAYGLRLSATIQRRAA